MKAIVYDQYGSPDVLELKEIDKPVAKDNEVLVRVRAASTNPYDWHFMRGRPYFMRIMTGLFKPKAHGLGVDVAGEVEAFGKNVTGFRKGDEVYGLVGPGRTFAEYMCAREKSLAHKPSNLTFEQAATVPLAALTALQCLRDYARIQPEQRVLIIGASGGVGTFAVQIARLFDAEVTGVCSTRNVDMVRSLGADFVIDYTREDFSQSGKRYDLIFQVAGTRSPLDCRRSLTAKGTLVLCSGDSEGRWIGPLDRMIEAAVLSPFVSQKLGGPITKASQDDLQYVKELIEAGKVTPVIDRTYPLCEVPEAIRYLEEGHARGKVVITV